MCEPNPKKNLTNQNKRKRLTNKEVQLMQIVLIVSLFIGKEKKKARKQGKSVAAFITMYFLIFLF